MEATKCAPIRAKRLTDGLDARVTPLVPSLQSFSVPFDAIGEDRAATVWDVQAVFDYMPSQFVTFRAEL